MYEKLPQELKDYPYMKLRNEVISLENSLREVEDTIIRPLSPLVR